MKIIGAGFGRTGTSSLKLALEELGCGPCYHMSEALAHPEHMQVWEAAAKGESVKWHHLLDGYNTTLDWPAAAFYEQLMEAYPDALVLLSVRDAERWYDSTRRTAYRATRLALAWRPVAAFLDLIAPVQQQAVRLIDTVVWQGVFQGHFEDKQQALDTFDRHIQEVTRRVPAERLLVYDVREGWNPLCRFLGVDVPEGKPFPHALDASAYQKVIRERIMYASIRLGAALIPLTLIVVAGVRYLHVRSARASVHPKRGAEG